MRRFCAQIRVACPGLNPDERTGYPGFMTTPRLTREGLVYYKKHSGRPRIPYNDAVEEALRFG